MKVILIQDVPKLGRKNEIKNVADGFGRNFIVARGLGLPATPENLKRFEKLANQQLTEAKVQEELLKRSLDTLKNLTLKLQVKASPEGHLFAGIHQTELAAALKKQHHLEFAPEMIELDKPIKQTGEYPITVKVGTKSGHFQLVVESL